MPADSLIKKRMNVKPNQCSTIAVPYAVPYSKKKYRNFWLKTPFLPKFSQMLTSIHYLWNHYKWNVSNLIIQMVHITRGRGKLWPILKSKWKPFFLVPFYMNQHNPKKFFDFVHFWPVAGIFCTSKFSEHQKILGISLC